MSEHTRTQKKPRIKHPQQTSPIWQRLGLMAGIASLGLVFVCVVFALMAFMPGGDSPISGSLKSVLAVLISPTSTSTPTSTATANPSPTPTLTSTPEETEVGKLSPTPTGTLTPTPDYTPTPFPTPDSQDREFYVPILMYHYISVPPGDSDIYRQDLSVTPDAFREQIQWLKDNGYTVITLYDLIYALNIGWPSLPDKPVVLTFDDGYTDNYENAFPILQEFGFVGTFFILTDVTDREQPGYMTWAMLDEMHQAGMDIEVHGREHVETDGRDEPWLVYHLRGASETIAANLGYQPRFLAYPAGQYDDLTIQVAQSEGYWGAVTTQQSLLQKKSDPYELKRLRIRGGWTLDVFAAIVSEGP
jgi:peptidoglycan/xylan/chitin deacetylase (PgdA/CDA1 family)